MFYFIQAFHVLWNRVFAPPHGIFPWLIAVTARRFPPLKSLPPFLATSLIVKTYIIPGYCWCLHLSTCSCIRLLQFILLQEFSYILNSSRKTPMCLCFISTAALLNAEFLLPSVSFSVDHCPKDISCVIIAPYVQGDYCQPTFLTRVCTQPHSTWVLVHGSMYVYHKLSSKTVSECWKEVFCCLWDAFVSFNGEQ